ncbi:hypothetical protein PR048_003590 [Dryococelus australis]|uniref:Uncharacterized protein n=1 Tax=Dryococelus australis TaxID=614101 RepID=A0ABQ9INJ5_9NEOP|nr:hypothetical protein PR048_003590 [Dryococelus australis]
MGWAMSSRKRFDIKLLCCCITSRHADKQFLRTRQNDNDGVTAAKLDDTPMTTQINRVGFNQTEKTKTKFLSDDDTEVHDRIFKDELVATFRELTSAPAKALQIIMPLDSEIGFVVFTRSPPSPGTMIISPHNEVAFVTTQHTSTVCGVPILLRSGSTANGAATAAQHRDVVCGQTGEPHAALVSIVDEVAVESVHVWCMICRSSRLVVDLVHPELVLHVWVLSHTHCSEQHRTYSSDLLSTGENRPECGGHPLHDSYTNDVHESAPSLCYHLGTAGVRHPAETMEQRTTRTSATRHRGPCSSGQHTAANLPWGVLLKAAFICTGLRSRYGKTNLLFNSKSPSMLHYAANWLRGSNGQRCAIERYVHVTLSDADRERLLAGVCSSLAIAKQKDAACLYQARVPLPFQVGDKVLCRNFTLPNSTRALSSKQIPKFIGPNIMQSVEPSATCFAAVRPCCRIFACSLLNANLHPRMTEKTSTLDAPRGWSSIFTVPGNDFISLSLMGGECSVLHSYDLVSACTALAASTLGSRCCALSFPFTSSFHKPLCLARDCEFKDGDEFIRDKIVLGTNDIETKKKKLLEFGDVTLQDAFKKLRIAEIDRLQEKSACHNSQGVNETKPNSNQPQFRQGNSTKGYRALFIKHSEDSINKEQSTVHTARNCLGRHLLPPHAAGVHRPRSSNSKSNKGGRRMGLGNSSRGCSNSNRRDSRMGLGNSSCSSDSSSITSSSGGDESLVESNETTHTNLTLRKETRRIVDMSPHHCLLQGHVRTGYNYPPYSDKHMEGEGVDSPFHTTSANLHDLLKSLHIFHAAATRPGREVYIRLKFQRFATGSQHHRRPARRTGCHSACTTLSGNLVKRLEVEEMV